MNLDHLHTSFDHVAALKALVSECSRYGTCVLIAKAFTRVAVVKG